MNLCHSVARRFVCLAALSAIACANPAFAQEAVSGRHVVDLGCHNDTSGICYVSLDGAAFGAGEAACGATLTNEFRFENANTDAGKRAYASFLSAFIAGKSIMVYLSGCTSQKAPALGYFHVTG